jgi:rSAM/selenodomain-associated transferase 1
MRLVVMVKEPRPGRVKTRLGRDIGLVPAAWWMRHQTARTLRRLTDPRWHLVLAVAPDTALASRVWPGYLPRVPQGTGDLGARMARLLHAPGPVLVVGADIPGLGRAQIARAFALLRGADAVIGPAEDGGFWGIGLRHGRPPAGLFAGVRWSTAHARADTLATLRGLRVALADPLRDVDTAAALSPAPGPR